ncbi:hypothetical protein GFK26_08790 [Variovorax paradoxus]|uniref:Uncharacterized protein n=1 Tax=Variovorax paradoxus TaxID=34073 RepID=A0A5Q0M0U5_VARPD|nr:hypothetical protein [Variovorax paradoxus]QFZ82848.1 hypothetical protein GFK26_08790 [Variovorax paradoxus]
MQVTTSSSEWFVAKALLALAEQRIANAQADAAAPPPQPDDTPAEPMAADGAPFADRLWRLLRIRRALTADEAASLLVDADDDVAEARRQAGALMLSWSRQRPKDVRIGARRVDGLKRYVLQRDVGATPPPRTAREGHPA